MPLNSLEKLEWQPLVAGIKCGGSPVFFKGEFIVDTIADTYLNFDNFTRGYCWINGVLLGRYDVSGPLLTTYVPAAILKKGKNCIEILELESMSDNLVKFQTSAEAIVKDRRIILK